MQKKLYYLDESEKNRILNLHEDRTRKQYLLKEQPSINLGQGSSLTSNSNQETGIENNWKNGAEIVKKIDDKCKNNASTDNQLTEYNNIKQNIDNLQTAGFFNYSEWGLLSKNLQNITLDKFCIVSNTLNTNKKIFQSLASYLYDRIYSAESFDTYFMKPLSNVLKEVEGKKIEANTDSTNSDTSETKKLEGCLKSQRIGFTTFEDGKYIRNVKTYPTTFPFNTEGYIPRNYTISQIIYYSNKRLELTALNPNKKKGEDGERYPVEKSKYYSWDCNKKNTIVYSKNSEDKKTTDVIKFFGIKTKGNTSPINNYKQGIGVVQQSKVGEFNQILKDLGVGNTLTQDAINKLYTKLGGK